MENQKETSKVIVCRSPLVYAEVTQPNSVRTGRYFLEGISASFTSEKAAIAYYENLLNTEPLPKERPQVSQRKHYRPKI
jgi:hypothetical protein